VDDIDRYNETNKHIACVETFFDVFNVVSKHGLLGEVKNTSISYLFMEASERLEAIRKFNKETFERLQELKRSTGASS
jgi:hypothetical protein